MNFQIVIYLFLVVSVEVFGKGTRIIGGEDAKIQEFPYIVSLKLIKSNRHGCGGTIIGKRHILSAAHCLTGHNNPLDDVIIVAGTSLLSGEGGSTYTILRIDMHPEYTGKMTDSTYLRHDIAVIATREAIVFSEFQKKINLPIFDVHQGDTVTLFGWGAISYPTVSFSDQLQKTTLSIVPISICSKSIEYNLRKDQICAFQKQGVGACIGDSGNPLIKNGKVIGVASFVIPCAIGKPDVYTNVYAYLDFIRSAMRNVMF